MEIITTKKEFPKYKKFEIEYEGRPLSMEVGKMGELCNAAVLTKYGNTTIREVKKFQKAMGLSADGICGPKTWEALDEAVGPSPTPVTKLFTVHIPHLTEYQADGLIATYAGSWKTEE